MNEEHIELTVPLSLLTTDATGCRRAVLGGAAGVEVCTSWQSGFLLFTSNGGEVWGISAETLAALFSTARINHDDTIQQQQQQRKHEQDLLRGESECSSNLAAPAVTNTD